MKKYLPLILILFLVSLFLHIIASTDYALNDAIINIPQVAATLQTTSPAFIETSWITKWIIPYPTITNVHEFYVITYWSTFALLLFYAIATGCAYFQKSESKK